MKCCRMNVNVYSSELDVVIQCCRGVAIVPARIGARERVRAAEVFKTFAANKHLSAGRSEPPADPDLRRLGVVSIDQVKIDLLEHS